MASLPTSMCSLLATIHRVHYLCQNATYDKDSFENQVPQCYTEHFLQHLFQKKRMEDYASPHLDHDARLTSLSKT